MINLPDPTPIIWLAIFGLICAALLVVVSGGWAAYHLFMALSAYIWG